MRWPWSKRVQATAAPGSVPVDAALFFPPGTRLDLTGVPVTEQNALGLSAYYRAVTLIAGTLASMPLPTLRTGGTGNVETVASIFDNPDPDGQTPYDWKETAFAHLLMHGAAGAVKIRTAAGGLYALPWVHPSQYRVVLPTPEDYLNDRVPAGGLWFDVNLADGSCPRLDANDFFYVPGLSIDGRTGVSLLTYARLSLGTSIAADRAAGRLFSTGALISGLATPVDEEDITADVPEIRRQLNASVTGYENAGGIAVVNRRLQFTPWTMSAADAQFLQSRQFQIEEIARWTGVPPHLLMQTEKQTSWGTGVEEQNRALGRTVLGPWATRFEQRGSRLLAQPRRIEFDFTGLERPSPDRQTELDLQQVAAGVMTVEEYRLARGWGPLPVEAEPLEEENKTDKADPGEDEGDDDAPAE